MYRLDQLPALIRRQEQEDPDLAAIRDLEQSWALPVEAEE